MLIIERKCYLKGGTYRDIEDIQDFTKLEEDAVVIVDTIVGANIATMRKNSRLVNLYSNPVETEIIDTLLKTNNCTLQYKTDNVYAEY